MFGVAYAFEDALDYDKSQIDCHAKTLVLLSICVHALHEKKKTKGFPVRFRGPIIVRDLGPIRRRIMLSTDSKHTY